MSDDESNALVFALCHEAGNLLTALRFLAGAPAGSEADACLRSATTLLGTRIGALLGLVRPLLDGTGDPARSTDSPTALRDVERELGDVGVVGITCRIDPACAGVRCDPEVLRFLVIARLLASVEPGEAPPHLTLAAEPCDRGVAIVVADRAPQAAVGSAPSGIALVERIAARVLEPWGGAALAERLPDGNRTRFELADS